MLLLAIMLPQLATSQAHIQQPLRIKTGNLSLDTCFVDSLVFTKATLILTNTLGVAVMTAELNGNQGQKVLDLRPLAAGVYGYSVRCGEHVMNGKIVVTK